MLKANKAYHIIIADDDQELANVLSETLEKEGFEITLVSTRSQGIYALEEHADLLLLDVNSLDGQGYEFLNQVRSDSHYGEVPIILVTEYENINFDLLGDVEAYQEIVDKPVHLDVLVKRIQNHLDIIEQRKDIEQTNALLSELGENLQQTNLKLIQKNEIIMNLKEELEKARIVDPLTGLHNRRYTMDQLGIALSRFNRSGVISTIIIGNIDHLRLVNDQYGTSMGDEVIRKIAQILTSQKRKEDIISRWSGEEFLILLPDTGEEGGKIFAERARKNIMKQHFETENQVFQVSMTFGVAVNNRVMSLDMLLRLADDAMLDGKELGRNRVVISKDINVADENYYQNF